jgi:hypothetical protein
MERNCFHLEGKLCINHHCEQSEAIQRNSGSPRRFAARDDDPVREKEYQGHRRLAGLFQSLFQLFDAEFFFIAGDKISGGIVFKHENFKT